MINIYFFCEGTVDSLDYKLLSRTMPIRPIPFNGKSEGSPFMRGYVAFALTLKGPGAAKCIAFRDRDFDYLLPEQIELFKINKSKSHEEVYASYRCAIENYLFTPELFWQYIVSSAENSVARRKFSSQETVAAIFREVAHYIAPLQAARAALGGIKGLPKDEPRQRTQFLKSPNQLPDNLDSETCRNLAICYIEEYQLKTAKFSMDQFHRAFDTYLEEFRSDAFLKEKYLSVFSGKNLIAAFERSKQYSLGPKYYDFAIKCLEKDLSPYPDLVQLRDLLQKSAL
jgi:hypothetical protein